MQTEINFGPDPQPDPRSKASTQSKAPQKLDQLIEQRDWTQTPVGPLKRWPSNLRYLFHLSRNSKNAMCIFWGKNCLSLYNEQWNHYFGTAFEMGQDASKFFDDEWAEVVGPAIEQVLSEGEAVRIKNFYWSTGEGPDCCYDLSLNPAFDETGGEVEGILAIATDVTERIEAKRIRSRVEETLKIDTVGVSFFDLEGNILKANDGFLKMSGYNREDLEEGRLHWDEMTPPEHMEVTQDALKELKETGQTEPYEKEYYRKDGSRWWAQLSSQMLEDGTAVEFVVDITDRKKSELKYQTLFKSIDQAFAIIQLEFDEEDHPADYRYLEVNPAFQKLTGQTNVEGKSTRKLLPDHEEYWFEQYGKVARNREPIRFENVAREFGRIYDVFAFPFGEPEEQKVAVLFDDITERKNAQEEREQILRRVETERQRLLDIFQHAPSFMCVLQGPDHIFERVNDQYKKLVGGRELEGKPLDEAMPELEGQDFRTRLDRVYETGQPYVGRGERLEIARESGGEPEERFINYVYQPYRDADGTITGIFAQGVDLTNRIKAEKKLKSINENLEERVQERTKSLLSYQDQLRTLASKLSKAEELERERLAGELHDNLGQMLAVSKMKVDLLRQESLPDQTLEDIDDLRELIQDALLYTRELMSDLKPPPSLDQEGIKASLDWLAKKMKKHKLNVIVEDDGNPKPVDQEIQSVLVQCVRELLFNIVKHAGVDKARVAVFREDSNLHIVVEDQGEGFDPENNHSSSLEGGFGLFNISERVDLLGGSVDINSAPGEGTRITICAPLKEQALKEEGESPQEIKVEPDVDEPQQLVKVLLVDDHEMMREGLRKIVNEEGDLQVIAEASDGREAIKKAQQTSPDVVVMDVNMPVMDGIDATQQLLKRLPEVRVIALSLHDHQNVIDSMRRAGATAYLTKNEAFETLCATIRSEATMLKQ